MAHDRKCYLVFADHGFVGDPVPLVFRKDGAKARAITSHGPNTLRRFTAGFPAEYDFAFDPRICLDVSDLERHGYHMFHLAGLDVHCAYTRRTGAHITRTEIRLDLCAFGE